MRPDEIIPIIHFAKGSKRHGRSQVNPVNVIGDAELDALLEGLVTVGHEENAETLNVIIPAGKTQTKHIERRFFARVKRQYPNFFKSIRKRVTFQAAKDSVTTRGQQKPKNETPTVTPGHSKKVNDKPKEISVKETQPIIQESKKIVKTVFNESDGDIGLLTAELRKLLKEAGIEEIHLRHDTDTVTLIG